MGLIDQLNDLMLDIGVNYAICGGFAIDLFLGCKTRAHKDLDVSVYWEDRDRIIKHMLDSGWDIYEPCGDSLGRLHKISSISDQKRARSNVWCVKPGNAHYKFTKHEKDMFAVEFDGSEQAEFDFVELLFNTKSDGYFLHARNHDIKMPMNDAIIKIGNTPCLAPEMALLYKSTAADNAEYQLDFEIAWTKMNEMQRAWLKKSLAVMFSDGHKWLEER